MTPRPRVRLHLSGLGLVTLLLFAPAAVAAPEGQLTWAVQVALAPTWFDPAETPGIITPFMVLYALHDALVKPRPGNQMTPSLAESWTTSPDGLMYEFVLRKGVRFQWDPKSPWADRRVRLAVNHAIDGAAMNQSVTLGFSRLSGSIIPQDFDFALPIPPVAYDPVTGFPWVAPFEDLKLKSR
jgi:ABC-type transport system substrate-binding protein